MFLTRGEPPVRLTQFSNLAIRVLMYAGLNGRRRSTVPEMADAYRVSYNHLKKVTADLCRFGYLETVRGRSGGLRLRLDPAEIGIGEVIRRTEGDLRLVECFDPASNTCPLPPACRLRLALQEALAAFLAVLDRYTLADLISEPERLAPLVGLDEAPPRASPLAGPADAMITSGMARPPAE
jgi:Rrf2 family nitric oxide-sensitive transcriptional repressor